MSGLWFGSYFRGCLGALGGSASHGKRRGGGWAFPLYSVEGCFVLYLVSHSSPSISQVISFGFHCVDFACTALAGGIWGWVSPGPSLGKTEKLSFWFLPSLRGAKTLPRREEGVVRSLWREGSTQAAGWLSFCVCSPTRVGPKTLQRTVEKQPWPPPWVQGTPAGPPGSDWNRHHQPLLWPAGNATVAQEEGGPLCLEPVWSSRGAVPQ